LGFEMWGGGKADLARARDEKGEKRSKLMNCVKLGDCFQNEITRAGGGVAEQRKL